MKTRMQVRSKYMVCVHNAENPASLELRKIYRTAPRVQGDPASMIRVIDESGEDYLYPRAWFAPINVPRRVVAAFA